jgi:pimeloyl-ACP methyl ester carboxylesterase
MEMAHLHDGAALDVAVLGEGPAVVLPVSTAVIDGEPAEQMRAWGADPNAGHTLATGLAEAGYRVVAADYEGHLARHPKPTTLTPDTIAADLLAIADAAGADRFAYYGYSWLALSGLQLALRTDRLTGLAMGGYPPLGGPYAAMLAVTRSAHRQALANRDNPPEPVELQPGDWESSEVSVPPEQTQQYVTLYEALQDFDERAALDRLTLPRLAFAGEDDTVAYGAKWDNVRVEIADPLRTHYAELTERGWTVVLVPGADHISAMHATTVLPILIPWLETARATP